MKQIISLLNDIRNGQRNQKMEIKIKYSKKKFKILDCLIYEGYIRGYKYNFNDMNTMYILLKYDHNLNPIISQIEIYSKNKKFEYLDINTLIKKYKFVTNELYILSTNLGILTHKEAIKRNVGGKLLFKIC